MIVEYDGRLGNNLFQYSTACLFSDKFRAGVLNPIPTKIIKFDNIHPVKNFYTTTIVEETNVEELYNCDVIESNLVFKGFFQSKFITNLFKKNRKKLFNRYTCNHTSNNVFVHVRLGDIYEQHDTQTLTKFAHIDYYRDCLKKVQGGFISSDSPNSEITQSLAREFNLAIYEDNPEDTIIFGSTFNTKILSLGTFSWWIGFLGEQKKIFCPDPTKYQKWHGDIFPFSRWKKK